MGELEARNGLLMDFMCSFVLLTKRSTGGWLMLWQRGVATWRGGLANQWNLCRHSFCCNRGAPEECYWFFKASIARFLNKDLHTSSLPRLAVPHSLIYSREFRSPGRLLQSSGPDWGPMSPTPLFC